MDKTNKSVFPLYIVNFIGTLGFSIVLPFLVILVTKFGGNAIIYGVVAATYPLFQLIGAPILGKWSDIYGRKRILLLSQIGTAMAWVIFLFALFVPNQSIGNYETAILGAFAVTIPLLIIFAARALDGLTGGNVSVANAYLADVTSEKDRKKAFGRMAVAANLGFIIGPAIAGLLGATVLEEKLPVTVALIVSTIAIFIIAIYLKESRKSDIKERLGKKNVSRVLGQEHKECYKLTEKKPRTKEIFKIKNVPYVLLLYFLIFLGFNFYYTAFPVHAASGLNWSVTQLGIYFSLLSFIMVIVQGPVLSRLSKKVSDVPLVIIGSIILGINFFILLANTSFLSYVAVFFFAIGNGLMWPSFLSVLSIVAGKTHQGAVQGFASSAGSLASIIGLIVGGILYAALGVITFAISGIIIFLVFLLSFRLKKMCQNESNAK